MELNICHLYPDLLNVYGDVGNILILKYRAETRGIKVNIINVSLNDDFNGENYDIVFFGGGQDYEQSIVSNDLIENKKEELTKYIEDGKVFLAICGGYQLLGKYYTAPNGEKLEGLGILDIYTEGGDTRFIGNTVIYNEEFDETYVGFENHSGRTYINDLNHLENVFMVMVIMEKMDLKDVYIKIPSAPTFTVHFFQKTQNLQIECSKASLEKKYGDVLLTPIDVIILSSEAKESIP